MVGFDDWALCHSWHHEHLHYLLPIEKVIDGAIRLV